MLASSGRMEIKMKLGAQLFSLRDECDTPEKLLNCLREVKKIGYDCAQASGISAIEPELFKSYIDEVDLPITCTHRAFTEICDNTEFCINFHKIIGCNVIGLGAMNEEYRKSYEGLVEFKKKIIEPIKKINDAGLRFAYHNHAFDFETPDGVQIYDYLINEIPELDFIHDVYWSAYAGKKPEDYIRQFAAAGRMDHVHFKDMKEAPQGAICACGDGIMDFTSLANVCREAGINYVYVEQDNAPTFGSLAEMAKSYKNLKDIVK